MIKYLFSIIFFINLTTVATYAANVVMEDNIVIDTLPNDFSQLNFKTVGKAKFSVLFWDIYNSTLYTQTGALFAR